MGKKKLQSVIVTFIKNRKVNVANHNDNWEKSNESIMTHIGLNSCLFVLRLMK